MVSHVDKENSDPETHTTKKVDPVRRRGMVRSKISIKSRIQFTLEVLRKELKSSRLIH